MILIQKRKWKGSKYPQVFSAPKNIGRPGWNMSFLELSSSVKLDQQGYTVQHYFLTFFSCISIQIKVCVVSGM